MIQGILFDIDGTLVLSNDAHAHAWVEAFAKYKYTTTFEEVRPLIGKGSDKLIPQLFSDLSGEDGLGKEIAEFRSELFLEKYIHDVVPAPGARELVEVLREKNIRTVVASSATSKELHSLLKIAGVEELLTEKTSSSDVENSKPDPDIVAVALKKIQIPPKQVLMIGDTPYDVEAAEICDVSVVAVTCGGWSENDLHGAWKIFKDPADVLSNLDAIINFKF